MNDVRAALFRSFRWRSDPPPWPEERTYYADYTRWWRDPEILRALGPGLAALFPDCSATVVMGTESRGSLVGPWSPHTLASASQRSERAPAGARTTISGSPDSRRPTTTTAT